MFVDQKTEDVFVPLNNTPNAGRLELASSETFEFTEALSMLTLVKAL